MSLLQQCADSSASADMSDGDSTVGKAEKNPTDAKEGTGKGSGVMGKIFDFKQRRQQRAAVGKMGSLSSR